MSYFLRIQTEELLVFFTFEVRLEHQLLDLGYALLQGRLHKVLPIHVVPDHGHVALQALGGPLPEGVEVEAQLLVRSEHQAPHGDQSFPRLQDVLCAGLEVDSEFRV